jgi:hypothetical protein
VTERLRILAWDIYWFRGKINWRRIYFALITCWAGSDGADSNGLFVGFLWRKEQ